MTETASTIRRVHRRAVSARVRILAWVLLLLAAAGAVALLLQRRVLHAELDREVTAGLEQEVMEVRRLAGGRDPNTGRPFAGDAAKIFDTFLLRNIPVEGEALVTFVGGRRYKATAARYQLFGDPALVARWANLQDTERGEVSTPAGPVRFLAVPLAVGGRTRGVFVVAIFVRQEQREIDRATRAGALVYGSVLVVAVGLAWLAAGRVLKPVRMMTRTARELTETDLSRRLEVPTPDDEIAELARTFNDMLGRLDDAFRHQREFLNDAGHELRTPITIIRGHLEVDGDDPTDRAATRALVLDELDRMARIVGDLLVLARAGQPDFLRREPVDLDLLTADLAAKAPALADRDWQLVGTGHGVVVADRQRVTQAMINLMDNATRHTGPGGRIELGSEVRDSEARLWVRDDGPGVPPADRERIFQRFTRADDGRRQPGTAGLGLAIVRAIAEAHDGRVTLTSGPGRGATFSVYLPVVE